MNLEPGDQAGLDQALAQIRSNVAMHVAVYGQMKSETNPEQAVFDMVPGLLQRDLGELALTLAVAIAELSERADG